MKTFNYHSAKEVKDEVGKLAKNTDLSKFIL